MLLTNLKIVPVSTPAVECGYIRMARGKIAEFGPMAGLDSATAGGEKAYDLAGYTAYPGFVDGHSHLGLFGDGLGFEGEDGNEATDPVTPHLRAIDAINPRDRGFAEALASGVTTVVVGPGSANPIGGQICALKTSSGTGGVDDMLIKTPVAMKFAFGENPKRVYREQGAAPVTRMATAAFMREALCKAQRYLRDTERAAADDEQDPPEFDMKCEALLPVLRGECSVHIHAHRADDIATAIRIAKEYSLQYVLVHCTEGHLLTGLLKKERARAICGPLIGHRGKPELANLTPDNPAVLAAAGVPVAICTDHPELTTEFLALSAALARRQGLPGDDALRAITLTPAQFAGIEARVGAIAVGMDADITLFSSDPLALEARPAFVFVDGKLAVGDKKNLVPLR